MNWFSDWKEYAAFFVGAMLLWAIWQAIAHGVNL